MALWATAYKHKDTEFSLDADDLNKLEIREAPSQPGFFYFYDTATNRLITDFVLQDRPQVALMCQVTLIHDGEKYSPRLRLWRKDKTKAGKQTLELKIPDEESTRLIKATVDTDGGHNQFWKLINYLQSLDDVDAPRHAFRVVDGESAELTDLLREQDRDVLLASLQTALGGSLTEADIALLANRKGQLELFRKLLHDEGFFEAEQARLGIKKPEQVWQQFFESNPWIFGYGLTLVSHESLAEGKLESVTTGANIFSGAGKRIDTLMRTRAIVSSLLFCEIKRHDTELLHATAYRPPDVFRPSAELSGGVAQLQKTVRKAERALTEQIKKHSHADGTPTDVDFSTSRPRQVLLIGTLGEFRSEHGVNGEMMESFELFRASLHGVEVITFDELYERARFIVGDN